MKQTIEVEVLEDYELSSTINNITFDGKKTTMIFWKKKQTKYFDYFVDQYLSEHNATVDFITGWIPDRDIEVAKNRLKTKQFDLVCWEIKIGLFRFICEERELSFFDVCKYFNDIRIGCGVRREKFEYTKTIMPQEFIDDLFKTKTN